MAKRKSEAQRIRILEECVRRLGVPEEWLEGKFPGSAEIEDEQGASPDDDPLEE